MPAIAAPPAAKVITGCVSSAKHFEELSTIARHRLVFEAVGTLMQTDIHALALETLSPP